MDGQPNPLIDYDKERARLFALDAQLAVEAEARTSEIRGNRKEHSYHLKRIELERAKIAGKLEQLDEWQRKEQQDGNV